MCRTWRSQRDAHRPGTAGNELGQNGQFAMSNTHYGHCEQSHAPALPQVINPQVPQSPHYLSSTAQAPWEQKWDQLGSSPSQSVQPKWRDGINVTSKAAA